MERKRYRVVVVWLDGEAKFCTDVHRKIHCTKERAEYCARPADTAESETARRREKLTGV